MSSSKAPRACPLLFTIGLVVHALGALALTAIFAGLLFGDDEMGDPIAVGASAATPLAVLAYSCVVAWGLRKRRPWAGWLALGRSVVSLAATVPLIVLMVFAIFLPPLIVVWFVAVLGEVLMFFGGIWAFVAAVGRARRPASRGQPPGSSPGRVASGAPRPRLGSSGSRSGRP